MADRFSIDHAVDGSADQAGRASVHDAPAQREVDLRRDAWLATLGIMVVRFSHRRLVHDTAEVRREILAVLAPRR